MTYNNTPFTFHAQSAIALQEWWHSELRKQLMIQHGAILIKGLTITNNSDFDHLINTITEPKNFRDGNSVRSKFTSKVYNASEYDQDHTIRLHTEYSYSSAWPTTMFFCCLQKAANGGESIIGDTRNIYKSLDSSVVNRFAEKGIRYTRNIYGKERGGMSWQEAFEIDDRTKLQQYCAQNTIECEWLGEDHLRLVQTRPAIRTHPLTNDKIWFNQVDQFFPQVYGEEFVYAMKLMYGDDNSLLPMYATYGDGEDIPLSVVDQIITALDKETTPVTVQNGEILVLDNMMKLHGRLPFSGDRRMVVAMS